MTEGNEAGVLEALGELLLCGALSLTSFDGHCIRIDFSERGEAKRMLDLLDEVAGLRSTQPPPLSDEGD